MTDLVYYICRACEFHMRCRGVWCQEHSAQDPKSRAERARKMGLVR